MFTRFAAAFSSISLLFVAILFALSSSYDKNVICYIQFSDAPNLSHKHWKIKIPHDRLYC